MTPGKLCGDGGRQGEGGNRQGGGQAGRACASVGAMWHAGRVWAEHRGSLQQSTAVEKVGVPFKACQQPARSALQ